MNLHLYRIAAHLAILDILLIGHTEVQDERNRLPAVRALEKIFFGHGLGLRVIPFYDESIGRIVFRRIVYLHISRFKLPSFGQNCDPPFGQSQWS